MSITTQLMSLNQTSSVIEDSKRFAVLMTVCKTFMPHTSDINMLLDKFEHTYMALCQVSVHTVDAKTLCDLLLLLLEGTAFQAVSNLMADISNHTWCSVRAMLVKCFGKM